MPFEIVWSDSAARQLQKLDPPVARRIFDKVGELAHQSFRTLRRLAGGPYYRLRVGDYRVIVKVREKELQVLVLKVVHRGSVY
jgi:mRNA interferase RelE/StbE